MNKIASLNGLRAISIIIVILYHLKLNGSIDGSAYFISLFDLFFRGGFGVNVFFVISGYLITTLLITEDKKTNSINLKHFYIRRTLRIFPAYYFLLLVYFIMQLLGYIHISNIAYFSALTYTKYIFKDGKEWFTGHAWSLSIEEHFYLFWPVLFKVFKKYRNTVPWLLVLLSIIYEIFRLKDFPNQYNLNILARANTLAIGCLFAIHKNTILNYLQTKWTYVIAIATAAILLLSYFENNFPSNLFIGKIFYVLGGSDGIISSFTIAFIMFYSIYGPKNWWHWLLNTKLLNFIGLLSYSLYLWQQLFTYKSDMVINKTPYNVIFLILAALFSYYIIEKPFLKLKDRFIQ
jgi:peptidoglycan/LPS O-acetylase OafA/YrhL